jgi:hypothetical protein
MDPQPHLAQASDHAQADNVEHTTTVEIVSNTLQGELSHVPPTVPTVTHTTSMPALNKKRPQHNFEGRPNKDVFRSFRRHRESVHRNMNLMHSDAVEAVKRNQEVDANFCAVDENFAQGIIPPTEEEEAEAMEVLYRVIQTSRINDGRNHHAILMDCDPFNGTTQYKINGGDDGDGIDSGLTRTNNIILKLFEKCHDNNRLSAMRQKGERKTHSEYTNSGIITTEIDMSSEDHMDGEGDGSPRRKKVPKKHNGPTKKPSGTVSKTIL